MAKIEKYLDKTVLLALLCFVFLQHRSFLGYVLNWQVIKNISPRALADNLIITPSVFLLFTFCFYSFGKRILDLILPEKRESGYSGPAAIALGMGAANLLFFFLGKLHLLYKEAVIAFLAAGAILWAYDFLKGKIQFNLVRPNDAAERGFLLIIAVSLTYGAAAALSPPVSWDALVYHLPIPKFYALEHGIFEIPGMRFQQCSIGGEMLNAAALLAANDRIPQLFSVLVEALFACVILAFGRENFNGKIAWASAALFAVTPAVLKVSGIVNNDLSLALFSFLAFVFFWNFIITGDIRRIYASVAFAGFAAAAKMSGLITCAFLALSAAALLLSGRIKIKAAQIAAAALIFVVIAGPMYYQKYAWTGNPVFPFFQKFINPADKDLIGVLEKGGREVRATEGVKATLLNFIILPYHLVKSAARYQDMPQFFIIPAVLVFILRIILFRKPSFKEAFICFYIVFYAVVWFWAGLQLWRHLLSIMPLMFMLTFEWVSGIKPKALRIGVGAVFLINLLPLALSSVNNELFAVFTLPSVESPGTPPAERYLEKEMDNYRTYTYINRTLPPGSKVFLYRELRGYYLERNYLWGDPINQTEVVYGKYAKPAELKKRLDELDVTHVLVNYNMYMPSETYYDSRTVFLMESVILRYCREIYEANGIILYSLKK
ncbi:MAG: glycosyltransferase family 39 protein [Elusimicrobiota bacterium]